MKPKTIITLLIIVAVLVAGYFIYRNWQQNQAIAANNYQTETIKRGALTSVIGATGTVRANQTALVAWQTNGQIGEINVNVDDIVTQDDILASIATNSLPQSVILAKADLVNARRTLDNLVNSNTARAQAQVAVANAQDALDKAEDQYDWKVNPRGSDDQIASADANLVLAQNQLDNAQKFFDMVNDRPTDDPVYASALLQLNNARTARDNAQANLGWFNGTSDQLEVTTAEAKLALATAQLEDAQREWNRLKDGPDPDDIAAAQARITALEATLDTANLKSPIAGTITEVNAKPGNSASAGKVSFRIDDLSHLLVDVEIPEIDINNIKVGQNAIITFDAIPNKEYNGTSVRSSPRRHPGAGGG